MSSNNCIITLPTIPRQVADAIESCREQGANNATILEYRSIRYTSERLVALRTIPFDTLMSALVNGYTVEKSAEELAHERIRHRYEMTKRHADDQYLHGCLNGIDFALNTLGIKIEGVNA